ncbi:MAG: hypothetical protein K2Q03_08085 [Sphingobacteriaceae bacterium]|nr:hypothetical protein [Sphingobacteriaceae bacterium]
MVANFLLFLFSLSIGLGSAYFLYKKNKTLSRSWTIILASARAITITLMCWLLFAPLIKSISYTLEKPIVVLAHDNSLSMAAVQKKGFDKLKYQKEMQKLSDVLSENFTVAQYSFSDTLKNGFDFSNRGKQSNASSFFNQIINQYQNRNLGAVIVASDGIFNRGGNPLYELNEIKAPIYTIALGDSIPKKDVLIGNVNYPNLVYLDNYFTADISLDAYLSKQKNVVLKVNEGNKTIFKQSISISSNNFNQTIPVKLQGISKGIHRFTISVSELENEVTYKNNSQTIFVEVIEGKQDVLIASAFPHPDITVLKNAIELDKHYKVKVVLASDLNNLEIQKYGLVVLYQLPEKQHLYADFLEKVKNSKASIWYFLGAQSNFSAFNAQQQLAQLQLQNSASLQSVFAVKNPNFIAFTLEDKSLALLDKFDPLQLNISNLTVNGLSKVVFWQSGEDEGENPLLFFMDEPQRKNAFMMGEGIWRWKLAEANQETSFSLVNELISKSVQYLTTKDDKKKFKVYPTKPNFDESEKVVLNAFLLNDNFQTVKNAEIAIQLKKQQNKVFNYLFSETESAYVLEAGFLPKGNYTYEASSNFGDTKMIEKGSFYVSEMGLEYQQTIANHQLMRAMAAQNNGKSYSPENLLQIAKELNQQERLKTLTYEDRKYEDLISFKLLFVLIVSLLTFEWFVRKRNGEL